MTDYAFKDENGAWVRILPGQGFTIWNAGEPEIDPETDEEVPVAVSFPPGWAQSAAPAQRTAMGVKAIIEVARPEGSDVLVLGETLEDHEGSPRQAWQTDTISLADCKEAKLRAADVEYNQRRQSPMSWDFGTVDTKDDNDVSQGPAGVQTLQMRDDSNVGKDDIKNWLAVAQACSLIIGAGGGDVVLQPLKVTSNVWVQTTANQALQALVVGDGTQVSAMDRGRRMLQQYGKLKKAINNAPNKTVLNGIDVSAGVGDGWPD